jgi:hypothetical protein
MVQQLRATFLEVSVSNGEVSIGQAFQFEVEKLARKKQVVFEYSERSNEQLRFEVIDGVPCIVANKLGILALAKLLMTIGAAQRPEGFCLHLRQDFDGDRDEVMRVQLEEKKADTPVNTEVAPVTVV